MSRLASWLSLAGCLSVTVLLGSACGGQSFAGRGEEGGSSNGGSNSQAGSGHAGTHTTAGTGQGGSGIAGSGQAGFASAGTGQAGEPPYDRCSYPPDAGQCDAYFKRWFHNPATNQCEQFVWGGCGGNTNNYETLADCQASCGGGNPTACNQASDCAIGTTTCCALCDGPNLSTNQFVAYNKAFAGQYICNLGLKESPPQGDAANPGSGIGAPVACPPCAAPLPGQGTLKYFVPDCVQGQCVVSDLRTSPVTACKQQTDCRLRNGTSCCEGCGGIDQYVSVRNDGSFEKQACGDGPVGCPACLPQPPTNIVSYCNDQTGHCEVSYLYPSGG